MPQNTNLNINISSGLKEVKPVAVSGALVKSLRDNRSNDTDTSKVEETSFFEYGNSKKYLSLQKRGLNNLRSELIAVYEFIPVSTETSSQEVAQTRKVTGDSQSVAVTNVSRLIELHRQIREYTINATNLVFEKLYPEVVGEEFLNWISKEMNSKFKKVESNTVETTVDSFCSEVIANSDNASYSDIVNKNKNNRFFKLIIEHFVYEMLVNDVVNYYSRISSVGNLIKKYWNIINFRQLKEFSPSSCFSSNSLSGVNSSLESIFSQSYLYDDKISETLIGLQESEISSDIDMLTAVSGQLASVALLKDSSRCLETLQLAKLRLTSDSVNIGVTSDLAEVINQIKKIPLAGFITLLGPNTEKERTGVLKSVYDPKLELTGTKFDTIFTNIKDATGEKVDSIDEGAKEAMVALCYDVMSYFANREKNNTVMKLNIDSADNGNLYKDYISNVLLGVDPDFINSKAEDREKRPIEIEKSRLIPGSGETNSTPGYGNFIKTVAGARKNNDSNSVYLPLESKEENNQTGLGDAITGIDNFLEDRVNHSDSKSSQHSLSSFSSQYKRQSINLLKDVLTLYPDEGVVSQSNAFSSRSLNPTPGFSQRTYFKSLLENLSLDLEEVLSTSEEKNKSMLPLLSFLLADYSHKSRIVKVFLGGFWSALIACNPVVSDISLLNAGDAPVSVNLFDITSDHRDIAKTYGRFIEYYNEQAVLGFFKEIGINPRSKGSDDKIAFAGGSNIKYRRLLGDGDNLFKKENLKNKLNSGKKINKLFEVDELDGSTSNLKIKAVKIDNVLNSVMSGGKSKYELKDISDGKLNEPYRQFGIYRVFSDSFRWALNPTYDGNYYDDIYKSKKSPIFLQGGNAGRPKKGILSEAPDGFGKILGLDAHHRALIMFRWVYNLLKKTIQIQVSTTSDGEILFKLYNDHIKGVIDCLKENSGQGKIYSDTKSRSYKKAYEIADNYIKSTLNKFDTRQRFLADLAGLYVAHADSLESSSKKVDNVFAGREVAVRSVDGGNSSLFMTELEKIGPNTVKDIINLESKFVATNLSNYKINFFKRGKGLTHLGNNFNIKKVNLMHDVLSAKNYGFLKSENFGNKSILNVGIPNSMVSALRKRAFRETGDENYLNSPYVCVSVFKKDHINPEIEYFPKNYLFDLDVNILDRNHVNPNEESNHIKNYVANSSFDKLLNSFEVTRFVFDEQGKIKPLIKKGVNSVFHKDVLINHVHDYALKYYMQLTTGINMGVSTFNLNQLSHTQGENTQLEFQSVLNNISRMYPNVENDDQMKSEVFRLLSSIRESVPFSASKNFKEAVSPKCFEKVYSIFVNEKDFVMKASENEDIYLTEPNFSSTCRLSRPVLANIRKSPDIIKKPIYEKYSNALSPNAPDVYNYYCQVTILPIGFAEKAYDFKQDILTSSVIQPVEASSLNVSTNNSGIGAQSVLNSLGII
jgi:hypothetical protein